MNKCAKTPYSCYRHPQLEQAGAAGAEQGTHHRTPTQLDFERQSQPRCHHVRVDYGADMPHAKVGSQPVAKMLRKLVKILSILLWKINLDDSTSAAWDTT